MQLSEYTIPYTKYTADQRTARTEDTWSWLGCRIRARGLIIWIRTDEEPTETPGGIALPPTEARFFAHHRPNMPVWGTVVSAAEVTNLNPGDRVLYPRDRFVWMNKNNNDGSFFGFIHEEHIHLVDTPE